MKLSVLIIIGALLGTINSEAASVTLEPYSELVDIQETEALGWIYPSPEATVADAINLSDDSIVDFLVSRNQSPAGIYAEKADANILSWEEIIRADSAPNWGNSAQYLAGGQLVIFVWNEGDAVFPEFDTPLLPIPNPKAGTPAPLSQISPFQHHYGNSFDAASLYDGTMETATIYRHRAEVNANGVIVGKLRLYSNYGWYAPTVPSNQFSVTLYSQDGAMKSQTDPYTMTNSPENENTKYVFDIVITDPAPGDYVITEIAGGNTGFSALVAYSGSSDQAGYGPYPIIKLDGQSWINSQELGWLEISGAPMLWSTVLGTWVFGQESSFGDPGSWFYIFK